MLTRVTWAIVPDANPDGSERNRAWFGGAQDTYDLSLYLEHVVRELPEDDLEFGFPVDGDTGPSDPRMPRSTRSGSRSIARSPCTLRSTA